MPRSTPYLYIRGSKAFWHGLQMLPPPVEYHGRCPATMSQGVTVRSTDARSASKNWSCWLGAPKGPLFSRVGLSSGASGKSVSVSIMVTWTMPYSKENQKGGFASILALLAFTLAAESAEVDWKAVGLVMPKRAMKAVKFFCPAGHSPGVRLISSQSASWFPGLAMYGFRPAMGASCA